MKKRPFIFQKAIGSYDLTGTFFFDEFSIRGLQEDDILLLMIRVKLDADSSTKKLNKKARLLVQSSPYFEVLEDEQNDDGSVKLDYKKLKARGEQKVLFSIKVKQRFVKNSWKYLRCIPDKLVNLNLSTSMPENIFL